MLGVVLNAVDSSSPDYYYSYRYYPYSYGGYGRDERESRKKDEARVWNSASEAQTSGERTSCVL